MLEKERRKPARRGAPKASPKPATATAETRPAAPAAPKAIAARPAAPVAAPIAAAAPRNAVSAAERQRMVAEAAYYRATRRGFGPGDPVRDWVEAEAEIDAKLLERP